MNILVFDLGGTSVKYAIWDGGLKYKNKFKTPNSWDKMQLEMLKLKKIFSKEYKIEGVALSAPGTVNEKERMIQGISAIPYIHNFSIYDDLEKVFQLPVTIENDANCAALAECWKGSAQNVENVILLVIGSGIGGSIIINRKLIKGAHLFGGEFGYNLITDTKTFSEVSTPVSLEKRYNSKNKSSLDKHLSSEEIFDLAENENNPLAVNEVNYFYENLARGIYNISYSLDPDVILIGGGLSRKKGLVENINRSLNKLKEKYSIDLSFKPNIDICHFKDDANLIGAIYNFIQNN